MTADADAHVIDDDEAVRESIDFLLRSAKLTVKTYEFRFGLPRGGADDQFRMRHYRRADAGNQRD